MSRLGTTPSQTVGPYLAIGLPWPDGPDVVPEGTPGRITISGRLFAGDGEGAWEVFTVKPGRLDDGQAPHIDVNVFARGMLNRCVTRIYFADEDNTGDPVLESVPEARRHTLIAQDGPDGYRFDVHVQGEGETVFFAL